MDRVAVSPRPARRTPPARPLSWMELLDHVIVGQAVLAPHDNHRAVVRVLPSATVNHRRRVKADTFTPVCEGRMTARCGFSPPYHSSDIEKVD